jgi:hypothetical protein
MVDQMAQHGELPGRQVEDALAAPDPLVVRVDAQRWRVARRTLAGWASHANSLGIPRSFPGGARTRAPARRISAAEEIARCPVLAKPRRRRPCTDGFARRLRSSQEQVLPPAATRTELLGTAAGMRSHVVASSRGLV